MNHENETTFVMGGSKKTRMVVILKDNVDIFDRILTEFAIYTCPIDMTSDFDKDMGVEYALFSFEASIFVYQAILKLYKDMTGSDYVLTSAIGS